MKDLDGRTIAVGKLFAQDSFFRIPEYQRPFSWDADNFDDLIDDVLTASKDQEYFLGTIVLHKRDDKGNHDVVDGQQRLTSILILLACLRDGINDDDYKQAIQAKILQSRNIVDDIPEKVRLEVKDREIFRKLVVNKGGTRLVGKKKQLPEPESRYVNAINIFSSKIRELAEDDRKELVNFISQKCIMIYLATSDFDDAFRLFTIVNDRGKQLRRIDILKSINISPLVVSKETVRNSIAQKWEELEKELGEDAFEGVFHLMRLIILKDKPQGDLLKEFENRIFKRGLVKEGERFFNLLFDYAKLYTSVFIDKDLVEGDEVSCMKYKALMHIMNSEFKASEWRACVLLFAYKHGTDKLYEFCLTIEKVYLSHWVKGVRKDERYVDYVKILVLIETDQSPEMIIKEIAYDENSIKEAVSNPSIYTAGYCKYMLLRLELSATEHQLYKEYTARSIEHVLPQNPEGDGYWADHHDICDIEEYVNSIGNLVLLSKSKNSSAKNFDFSVKKERYLKNRVSDFPRSIEVLGYDHWLKETILERTENAKDLVLSDP